MAVVSPQPPEIATDQIFGHALAYRVAHKTKPALIGLDVSITLCLRILIIAQLFRMLLCALLIGTKIRRIIINTSTYWEIMNTLTVAELKRRGMSAIEDGLRLGPVHILKRNRPAAVVITEDEYQRLVQGKAYTPSGMSAVQWLLAQPSSGTKSKADLDEELCAERDALGAA